VTVEARGDLRRRAVAPAIGQGAATSLSPRTAWRVASTTLSIVLPLSASCISPSAEGFRATPPERTVIGTVIAAAPATIAPVAAIAMAVAGRPLERIKKLAERVVGPVQNAVFGHPFVLRLFTLSDPAALVSPLDHDARTIPVVRLKQGSVEARKFGSKTLTGNDPAVQFVTFAFEQPKLAIFFDE
jgi:hypothetical protein